MPSRDGTVKANFYIRVDQREALRKAAASKKDARGNSISAIVQKLLDEAGYAKKQQKSE